MGVEREKSFAVPQDSRLTHTESSAPFCSAKHFQHHDFDIPPREVNPVSRWHQSKHRPPEQKAEFALDADSTKSSSCRQGDQPRMAKAATATRSAIAFANQRRTPPVKSSNFFPSSHAAGQARAKIATCLCLRIRSRVKTACCSAAMPCRDT